MNNASDLWTIVARPSRAAGRLGDAARTVDGRLSGALRPIAVPLLRVLLGVVFVWFGALKVTGASPVQAVVTGTLPWVDPDRTVAALGAVELVLGLGLVTGFALRLALPVLAAHLCGTFLTFVMLPALMVRDGNPLLLTATGEFVVKNLVLVAAAVVLIAHTPGGGGRRGGPRNEVSRS